MIVGIEHVVAEMVPTPNLSDRDKWLKFTDLVLGKFRIEFGDMTAYTLGTGHYVLASRDGALSRAQNG